MARPRKPDLSQAEWLAIEGKGDRVAAGIVSRGRGAFVDSISAVEANRRGVSHEWVAQKRKNRQKTQPSENVDGVQGTMPSRNQVITDYTGPRISRSETSDDFRTQQKPEENPSSPIQVDVEDSGAETDR